MTTQNVTTQNVTTQNVTTQNVTPQRMFASPMSRERANMIISGKKTVEAGINVPPLSAVRVGNAVLFDVVEPNETVRICVQVLAVEHYTNSRQYLECEGLRHCCPGVTTIDEGIATCRERYSEESEVAHGVIAISFAMRRIMRITPTRETTTFLTAQKR